MGADNLCIIIMVDDDEDDFFLEELVDILKIHSGKWFGQ